MRDRDHRKQLADELGAAQAGYLEAMGRPPGAKTREVITAAKRGMELAEEMAAHALTNTRGCGSSPAQWG